MFRVPIVFLRKVKTPTATLLIPVVLAAKAFLPTAVLLTPVVLLLNAQKPTVSWHLNSHHNAQFRTLVLVLASLTLPDL